MRENLNVILGINLLLTTALFSGFEFGECSGTGSFEQEIHQYQNPEDAVVVGSIPLGIKGLHIELISDKDVDIRLYGQNNDKVVHWPNGILSRDKKETKPYKDVNVTYSGYNGTDGNKGHEFIEVKGTTPSTMIMKAFGYKAGYATVNYRWTGQEECEPKESGEGSFTQNIIKDHTTLVGTIPPNVNNLQINLNSEKDIDIQLYGADGTAIVSWKPKGLLSGATKQSILYHDMNITWSGYNGTDRNKGHEYIKISGVSTESLVMKVFGYESGEADVSYSWGDLDTRVLTLDTLKAFPTAEGAGAEVSGGRGGKVVYVTNRDASGEGSLRWALSREYKRTIVFAIGGRFNVNQSINLGDKNGKERENLYSNFTFAGQTAWDKGGVHLANDGTTTDWARHFNIYGQENMILRYFDTRFNWQWYTKDNASDQHPSIRFVNSSDLIVDHMTSGWSAYGLIVTNSFRGNYDRTVDNITVQRSLFHENIINPDGIKQKNHNVGLLLGVVGKGGSIEDWNKVGKFSIHKNAFIGISHRFPNTAGGDTARFNIINNYVHGFDGGGHKRLIRAGGNAHNDFINNVYQKTAYSPDFSPSNLIGFQYEEFIADGIDANSETPNFYIDGNLFLSNSGDKLDITDSIQKSKGREMLHVWTPSNKSSFPNLVLRESSNKRSKVPVKILKSDEVKNNVLDNVGANIKFNSDGVTSVDNPIDTMYLDWAKNQNAPLSITSTVGDGGMGDQKRFKHPTYNTDPAINLKSYDSDLDGMPNRWEDKHGLDSEVANNNNTTTLNWDFGKYKVINNAGYTDLEMYLADIAGDFHMLASEK
ncbi:MAG: hypothetical protein KAG56_02475 [Sulfurovaceae bacterium]|nr:hypothetical protein [Sulfurovaceae bacterium]